MNRLLLIFGGLLVGLLAALFIVPAFVDWTRYRGMFEEEASRLLGRDVRVGGRVNLRLLPAPYVRFEKVRIADTQASVGELLFRAEDFTVWLAVTPLLKGDLQASRVELRKPTLALVLDDKGSGNWAALAAKQPVSALAPANVVLDQVRITDGTVAVFSASGVERTRIEHVNGELSAAALEGPYRLAVAFSSGGVPRELRLGTAKSDADGSVRFKGTVRTPQDSTSYTLDGRLQDIFRQPRLTGELSARLPLVSQGGGAPQAKGGRGAEAVFDLKANVKADTVGAEISDLALSFEQDGRPQLATGRAVLSWQREMVAWVEIASRWLDLDRMGGRDDSMGLPELAQRFAKLLDEIVPAAGQSTVKLALDQATLGGDIVSGLGLTLERKVGVLSLQASASLPGASRLQAAGVLVPQRPEAIYSGDLSLKGASLARFGGWALRNTPFATFKQDGAFAIGGTFALGQGRVSGRNLVIELLGNSLSGEAAYALTPQGRQISMTLDGPHIDVSALVEAGDGPATAAKALVQRLRTLVTATAGGDGKAALQAKLRFSRVVAGRSSLRDVTVDVALAGGSLAIPVLRFGADDGWSLELRGDAVALGDKEQRGAVAYAAVAETAAGLKELMNLAGLDSVFRPGPRRNELMLPLRVAGRGRVGAVGPGIYDVSFDGNLGQARTSGSVRIDPRGESWREAVVDAAVSLDGGDTGALIEMLAPEALGLAATAGGRGAGRMTLRGVGTAKGGFTSMVALDAEGLTSEFRGRAAVTETAGFGFDGTVRLAAADLSNTLVLLGGRERTSLAGVPATGTLSIVGTNGRLTLESPRVLLGNTALAGKLEVETRDGRNSLAGRVAVDTVSLPAMLAMLTAKGNARAASAAPATSAWNEDPIDLAVLGQADSTVRIETGGLTLAPGIDLGAAVLEASHKAGRFELRLVEAAALDGKASGVLALEKAPAGARASLTAKLVAGKLDGFAVQGAPPAATGALGFDVDLEGAALSPRGLVAALRGKGEMKLGQVRLNRLTPRAILQASEAILAIKGEVPAGELQRRLEPLLAQGIVPLGNRTLPIVVGDGVLRLPPFTYEGADGRITATASIDLEELRFDSEWRLEAAAPPPTAQSQPSGSAPASRAATRLPVMAAIYTGPLASLGRVAPRLQIDELEREITVRRMERDLEELERLRRQDEERARQEAERQRLLEAERQRQELERAAATARQDVPPGVVPTARPERPAGIEGSPPAGALPVPAPQPAARPDGAQKGAFAPPLPGAPYPLAPPPVPAARPLVQGQVPGEPGSGGAFASPPLPAPAAGEATGPFPAPASAPPRIVVPRQAPPVDRGSVFRDVGRSGP